MKEVKSSKGWRASLDLEYAVHGGKTRLANKRQSGPLTLQRSFYPEGPTCHNYILHPPGGVVGGDSLHISASAGPAAHALLTTPGATKFYRSDSNSNALQQLRLTLAPDAILEWLPQPNIYFNGTSAQLNTEVDIARGARFIGWDMHCFGRPSNDERFTSGAVSSQTRINVGGELRLLEQFRCQGNDTIDAATGLRGLPMQGVFIASPCSEEQKSILEQILHSKTAKDYPHPVGLTLVDEVMIVRALGIQAEPMQQLFTRLWAALRQDWLHKSPCMPRIWAT